MSFDNYPAGTTPRHLQPDQTLVNCRECGNRRTRHHTKICARCRKEEE